ncbi:hypothetical protein GCM10028820_18390 [Tessaracoccus terricola]
MSALAGHEQEEKAMGPYEYLYIQQDLVALNAAREMAELAYNERVHQARPQGRHNVLGWLKLGH